MNLGFCQPLRDRSNPRNGVRSGGVSSPCTRRGGAGALRGGCRAAAGSRTAESRSEQVWNIAVGDSQSSEERPMADPRDTQTAADKDPEDWVTGDESMTGP